MLNLKYESNKVPADSQAMVEDIVARLGLVLENARLIEASQKRLEREFLSRQITSRMRETLDMDTVMRTAVQEISQAFGVAEVEVRLGEDPDDISGHVSEHDGNGHSMNPESPTQDLERGA